MYLGLLNVGLELCAGEGADDDDGAKGGRNQAAAQLGLWQGARHAVIMSFGVFPGREMRAW